VVQVVEPLLSRYGLELNSDHIVTVSNPEDSSDTDDDDDDLPVSAMLLALVPSRRLASLVPLPSARTHRYLASPATQLSRRGNASKSAPRTVPVPHHDTRQQLGQVNWAIAPACGGAKAAFARLCREFWIRAVNTQGQLDFEPKFYLSASI